MAERPRQKFPTDEVRIDFQPKDDQTSAEFAQLEADRLWPYVWQVACREEEIPKPGDFVTYDILDDSIIVTRTAAGVIKAYHNVCPHRGRQLTEGCGRSKQFKCRFHGWEFDLDGNNTLVIDCSDFSNLDQGAIALKQVKVDLWGGFVFINMDPDAEPLQDFLAPVNSLCEKFEFDKLRYRYYKTGIMPCNWKTAAGFFNEFYHVQQAHPQFLEWVEDYSFSGGYGRHSAMWYPNDGVVVLARSKRLPPVESQDVRDSIIGVVTEFQKNLGAMTSNRAFNALPRLHDIPADASPEEVLNQWGGILVEEAIKDGAGWPMELTAEYIEASRNDWHVFPNFVYLHGGIDNVLFYRFRPNGSDQNSSIMDVWSLERFAPEKVPPLKREFYTDWRDPAAKWGRVLEQDFANMLAVQKGMKSRAFKGSLLNPVQEASIWNFYRALREFMNEGPRAGTYRDQRDMAAE